jgi:hypothetical protein
MEPPLGGVDPGLEPVVLPALWPDQHHPGRLHEQNPQVAIAALGYLTEDGVVSRRYLLGHQSKPGAEVAAFGEQFSSADRGAADSFRSSGRSGQALGLQKSTDLQRETRR